MHKKRKVLQRSVLVQSTDLDIEDAPQTSRLCKKAGFRNLLYQSVTVAAQEEEEEDVEDFPLPDGRRSKCVQTTLDSACALQNLRRRAEQPSLDLTLCIPRDDDSRKTTSEMVKELGSSCPGTSRMTSTSISALSLVTQVSNMYLRTQEGSLAVVYSYESKAFENLRSSNLNSFYGSQESRRFSDETVILIEDYQSYDYRNAAGRQETDFIRRQNTIGCCVKTKRIPAELLPRPLVIELEDIIEKDDANVCRICHDGEEREPLIQPCLCKGTVGSVHASCLKVWLEQSNTSRCELCNYPYAIRQTKKYPKCLSIKVFFKTVVDRRSIAYDVISFVVITPLTLVGVAMCIQASMFSTPSEPSSDTNYQMGNITKAGMIMLSGTIVVAYGVWLYTLISYHYKSWKKWYNNCYDVEVIPVRMTSQERMEAARRVSAEINRRQMTREQGSALLTVLHTPNPPNYSLYQRRVSIATPMLQADR